MTCSRTLAALLVLCLPVQARSAVQIKIATLAPEGTTAMKVMRQVDEELKARTKGELSFKFYAGGRQGDEKDVVRKIRLGQLHAGGFTGVGLGEVAPEVRVVDGPWLFRDSKEVDHIYGLFAKDFEKALADKGFILLGWTEVGFVYVFSKAPVRSAADIDRLKLWVWEGDPIAEAALKAIGVHPIPLSVTDVNTSLQTGMLDAVYGPPLYVISLQWHEKMKALFKLSFANASGAVLLSKKLFDSLPKDQQEVLLEVSRRHLQKLNELTRQENEAAIETLRKRGFAITAPATPKDAAVFDEAGLKARRELVGRMYSADILNRVEKALADYRAKKK